MSTPGRIALIGGVALLAIVVVGAVIVLAVRPEAAAAPTPSPTSLVGSATAAPSASVSSPTPTATPSVAPDVSPELDPEIARLFARIEDEVLEIRGLPRANVGPPDILSRDELAAEFLADFERDYTHDERRADNVTLRAMGLLEPDQDVAELQLALLQGNIAGFYDDDERRMVVVTDAGITVDAMNTYAHEYTHALQDATFGIDSFDLDAEGDDDGATARLSVLEGDAMLTMFAWSDAYLRPGDAVPAPSGDPGDADGSDADGASAEPDPAPEIPDFLVESLYFPYNYGTPFVNALHAQGGYDAVNRALDNPPLSTEQIINPELYLAGAGPVDVSLPDIAAGLGDGWEQVESTPIGEAMIATTLDAIGTDRDSANAAAAGWGGDRLAVAAGPDDAFAMAWRLAWDSPVDGSEFAAVYRSAAEHLDFPADVVELSDGSVLVAQASTAELVQRVVSIASG